MPFGSFNEILEFLKSHDENTEVEFKEGVDPKDLGSTIASMATEKGGNIFIGVRDNKEPIGVIYNKDIVQKIYNVIKSVGDNPITTEVNQIKFNGGERCILHIKVLQGFKKPYSYQGVYYRREGARDCRLDKAEIMRLTSESEMTTFCSMPAQNFERAAHIGDIDEIKIKNFADSARNSRNRLATATDKEGFLRNHDLLCSGGVNVKNAAVILFGTEPQKFVPQLRAALFIHPSNTIGDSFEKRTIEGDVINIVETALATVQHFTRRISIINENSLQRKELSEYPVKALREALINALVHRDYFTTTSDVEIHVFRDRVVISNPGGLPFRGLTLERALQGGRSERRNRKLADLMDEVGYFEGAGSGLKRMDDAMLEHGLKKPEFASTTEQFTVTFYSPGENYQNLFDISRNVEVTDLSRLNDRQIGLIKYLNKGQVEVVTNTLYRSITGATFLTASRELAELVGMRILEKRGRGRGSHYVLVTGRTHEA